MRYSVWDPYSLEMYRKAGLSLQQRTLIEGLLRSLETGTYLSEHVSSAGSVVLAITRASHALTGHAHQGQPLVDLTRTVLSRALAETASAIPAFAITPLGNSAITQIHQTMSTVSRDMAGRLPAEDKRWLASQVASLVDPAARAVRPVFEAFWSESDRHSEVAGRIRQEVAALVALEGRDGMALRIDLLRMFGRRVVDAAAVSDVLWPARKRFRVALVISGTRVLQRLEQLLPGVRQRPLAGLNPSKGLPDPPASKLVGPALIRGGPNMTVILPAVAADAQTAAAEARRNITETLDQYAAGSRLLELTVDPQSLVIGPDNVPLMLDSRSGGTGVARPLTDRWSEPLRPALRMAGLARRMDAPVASVMLAWSAIESMGVAPGGVQAVAKACALQSLRQQILGVYQSVADSANDRLRHGRWRVERAQQAVARAQRSHARAMNGDSAQAEDAVKRLEASVARAQARLSEAELSCAQLEKRVLPNIEIVRRHMIPDGDPEHPTYLNVWNLDLNTFLDAIIPLDASSPSGLQEVQDAIAALATESGGLAEEILAIWRRRLAEPIAVAMWLDHQQHTFHMILSWMYVSRNLAIHTGQFAVPADLLTAQAGRSIVDMILEFLGHWHREQRSQGVPESEPRAIVRELAEREEALIGHLRNENSCRPLNVRTITGYNSDCWNRS